MWEDFALYVAVGFLAQLVDGAIGMAFGGIVTLRNRYGNKAVIDVHLKPRR